MAYQLPSLSLGLIVFVEPLYISNSVSICWDFSGGPVVRNLPCNAGDMGLTLGWGTKIPHATEPLSPCTTTAEQRAPQLESVHLNKSSHMMQVLQLRPDTTNKLIYYSMSILFFEHPENLEAWKKNCSSPRGGLSGKLNLEK